jgi:ATP-binding cassette, subfamily G (WHITE), member 2, PDR
LTIGVELAAKPQLLLFLDEPTSGLDSQTSWAILDLLEKLTAHGQAILCTIHQPSAMLFQRFDRLLFLAAGGKPVYFGEIGPSSSTLITYFQRNGAKPCPPNSNPAEWMMEVIGAAPGSTSSINWPEVWHNSAERAIVHAELDRMKTYLSRIAQAGLLSPSSPQHAQDEYPYHAFAASFPTQLHLCLHRIFTQYWRTPSYIYSKTLLCILTSLFIGLSFLSSNTTTDGLTQQSLQNQMLGIFMLMTIFGNIVQQIFPNYMAQRSLFEARERQSRTYSWPAFLLCNILVELPWNSLMALLIFLGWYYPSKLHLNAPAGTQHSRAGTMFALVWSFTVFTSTFSHFIIAGIEIAQEAANLANLLFVFCIAFCGVLASPTALPRFWVFMYRVSPFTYLVAAMLGVGVADNAVRCADVELLHFDPPLSNSGPTGLAQTCAEYLAPFLRQTGGAVGYLTNPQATTDCAYCPVRSTNSFLTRVGASPDPRVWWRDFGIVLAFAGFNVLGAVLFYWGARVPRGKKEGRKEGGKEKGKETEEEKKKKEKGREG